MRIIREEKVKNLKGRQLRKMGQATHVAGGKKEDVITRGKKKRG